MPFSIFTVHHNCWLGGLRIHLNVKMQQYDYTQTLKSFKSMGCSTLSSEQTTVIHLEARQYYIAEQGWVLWMLHIRGGNVHWILHSSCGRVHWILHSRGGRVNWILHSRGGWLQWILGVRGCYEYYIAGMRGCTEYYIAAVDGCTEYYIAGVDGKNDRNPPGG